MTRLAFLAAILTFAVTAAAQQATPPPPNDYSKPETWLCRPGVTGACTSDQRATEIAADGSLKPVPFERPANPPFDCFYVYPTASEDATPYSDMNPGREIGVTTAQFGRYGAVCRQFAPLYRSFTLSALRARNAGSPTPAGYANTNYDDVVNAWNYYLQHDNNGRGVILVGHSQGAGLITRLIQNEIEGKPVARQIIAAHTLGTTVQVPSGQDVGGTYKTFPLCTRADQIGCVVVYGSYRSTLPPSIDPPARFGRAREGTVAACTNPAALSGGKAALDTYQTRGMADWAPGKVIDTPYVRMPGLATAECVTRGAYTYLEITVNGSPDGPRRNVVTGDVGNPPDPTWGLHNGDMSLAIGDLVNLARRQATAWAAARP
jgi:pimeloyl-ACP methyl ester carboxylesterase